MKLIDIIEYMVLFAFIYTILFGPVSGKQTLMYVSILGFFMFSGTTWLLSEETQVSKEYRQLALPIKIIAILIGILTMVYIWLL